MPRSAAPSGPSRLKEWRVDRVISSTALRTEFEADPKRKKEPLLLGAAPIKSELVVEVCSQQHHVVMAQWTTFLRAVSEADEFCVMGYSFPKEDAYGRFLIRQAIRKRRGPIRRVDLYEVPAKFEEVRDAIVEVLGVSPNDVADRGPATRSPC